MINVLKINLNCCREAQALMHQTAINYSADYLIVSEPNKQDGPHWYLDANNNAAIINSKYAQIADPGFSEAGFRWISISGTRIYLCYRSPNTTMLDFRDFLFRLERSIRSTSEDILLAGEFNVKHSDWGSQHNDQRDEALTDMVHALGLITCNTGNSPTFKKGSILDVTFSSPNMAATLYGCSVLDVESLSDHMYIKFAISPTTSTSRSSSRKKWRIDYYKLKGALNSGPLTTDVDATCAEECAAILTTRIHEFYMTESVVGSRGMSVYWWSPEIYSLRKCSNHARRSYQRKKKRMGPAAAATEKEAAKDAKRLFVKAIKKAKEKSWKSLCDQVEHDSWGTPYKLVMGKMSSPPPLPVALPSSMGTRRPAFHI